MSAQFLKAIVLIATVQSLRIADARAPIAKPNCTDHCGDVIIPFPFGIGVGCFLDHWFEVECRKSNGSIKPYLANFTNIEVISLDYYFLTLMIVGMPPVQACAAGTPTSVNFTGTPYSFSTTSNAFMVEGCSGSAVLRDVSKKIMAGCGTVCGNSNTDPLLKNSCSGVDCCQTVVYGNNTAFYDIDAYPQGQTCLTATLINQQSVNQYVGKLSGLDAVPVVMSWSWISKLDVDNNKNDSHVHCERGGVYGNSMGCACIGENYYGNAYVSNGCQVPEECKGCQGKCYAQNDDGTHRFLQISYYCEKKSLKLAAILGLSISLGIVLLVIGLYGLYRFVQRRREIKRRANYFKRNGGLLLHQQLISNDNIVEGTKIFTISELDKATDHFNENRILGQGGQGTVYKGMLVDGRIVAIKKAKLLDESQLEQFINEVVILSQINHRNVVKLLGCCLETEVPLLVYEFIPNGTLFEHIHQPDGDFAICWAKRLQIVLDSACAIAYLHSSSSLPYIIGILSLQTYCLMKGIEQRFPTLDHPKP